MKCCRQLEASTPSLYLFAPESRQHRPQSNWFFSWLLALNENLGLRFKSKLFIVERALSLSS